MVYLRSKFLLKPWKVFTHRNSLSATSLALRTRQPSQAQDYIHGTSICMKWSLVTYLNHSCVYIRIYRWILKSNVIPTLPAKPCTFSHCRPTALMTLKREQCEHRSECCTTIQFNLPNMYIGKRQWRLRTQSQCINTHKSMRDPISYPI